MNSILLVEDSLTQALRLEFLLQEHNYTVYRAEDGHKALAMMQNQRPDLVVSDITMPGMNGFELCAAIKSNPHFATIPVLLLTNLADPNHVIHGLNAKADGYVTKPYDDKLLLERVASFLSLSNTPNTQNLEIGPLKVEFGGTRHTITANRQQILNFFLSTYENTLIQNRILVKNKLELSELNNKLLHSFDDLKDSEERFRSLVQTIPDIVYKIDAKGYFTFLNESIERLGYQQSELLGQHFSALVFHLDIEQVSRNSVLAKIEGKVRETAPKLFDEKRSGARMTLGLEVRLKSKSGHIEQCGEIQSISEQTVFVEINSSGVYGETHNDARRHIGTVGVIRDITERKKVETFIHHAKEKAEYLAKKAEAASEAKGHFLANMSHEIRTPMNAILNLSYLALQTDLNPKQQDYLKKIHASGSVLLEIINDILDFSKIEADKLSLEQVPFRIDDVLDHLSNTINFKVDDKDLEILFDRDSSVPNDLLGDSLRLGQILINLTHNAIKFTDSGEIVVSIQLVKLDSEKVTLRFSVKDTGIGMTQEQQQSIFQAFNQADNSITRKYGGSGLGLAICKRLINMMHGDLQVDSTLGQGSTFYFSSDFKLCNEKTTLLLPAVAAQLQKIKALIVDDREVPQQILKDMLESFSIQVITTSNGEDALALLEQDGQANAQPSIKLVLLDWKMPGMDGLEVAEKIKNSHRIKPSPEIIMITAYGSEEVRLQVRESGISRLLVKPISHSVLLHTILEVFGIANHENTQYTYDNDIHLDRNLSLIQNANILLVEDDEINQQIATELLEQKGFIITVVNSGANALEVLDQSSFDLVLMDLQMPGLDGYQTTQMIRQKSRFQHLPIIAMTAHAMLSDREKCLRVGMNDHLTKPVKPQQLYMTLIQWIPIKNGMDVQTSSASNLTVESHIEEVSLPPLAGIAIQSGIANVGGNHALYRKLLGFFYDNNFDSLKQLRRSIAAKNLAEAKHIAHSLKGVAGNISANYLFQEISIWEKHLLNLHTLDESNLADILILLHPVEKRFDEVLASIASLDNHSKNSAPAQLLSPQVETMERSRIVAMLNQLTTLIEQDYALALNHFDELRPFLNDPKIKKEYHLFEKQLYNFDTDEAKATLDLIVKAMNSGANKAKDQL